METLNNGNCLSNEIYEVIVDSLDVAVHVVDKEMSLIFINKEMENISHGKIKQDDIKGRNLYNVFPFLKEIGVDKEYKKVLSTGKPLQTEEWTTYKGERICTITKKIPIKNKKGQVVQIITVMKNLTKRKAAETLLKEVEIRYKALFNRSLHCVYIHDFEGNFLDANEAALKLLGYKREDIKDINISSLIEKEQLPIAFEMIKEIMQKGSQNTPIEYKLIRKDGQHIWVETEGSLIYKDGKPIAILGIAHDITERRDVEKTIKESEEKFRTLVDNLNAGVYRNTPGSKGTFIEANPAIIKIFGYKNKEEFLKINVSDLYHNPRDRKRFNEKILKKGFVKDEELKLTKKNGASFWASVTAMAVKDETGKISHYDGIIEDISERKQMELALKDSEKRYRSVVENANDAIYVITPNGFEYVNKTFKKLVGYKVNEIRDKKFNFWDIIHSEDKKLIKKREIARKKGKKLPSRYEFRIIAKDGKTKVVEATTVNIGREGEVKVMGILRDITERRKAEERAKFEREQLLSIFEGINEPIYVSDAQTYEILYANETIEKIFGKNVVGSMCYEVFQHFEKPCDFCTNEEILGKNFGKTCIWESQNRVTKRWHRNIDKGIKWPDGREVRFELGVDITDKINAEVEMIRALEEERKFKLDTAHYFFNPIAIAKGYLYIAMEEVPKKQKEKLGSVLNAIERVETVVKNVVKNGQIRE